MRIGRVKGVAYGYKPVREGEKRFRIMFGGFREAIKDGMCVPIFLEHDHRKALGLATGFEEKSTGLGFTGILFAEDADGLDLYRRVQEATDMGSPLGVSIGVGLTCPRDDATGKVYERAVLREVSVTPLAEDVDAYILSAGMADLPDTVVKEYMAKTLAWLKSLAIQKTSVIASGKAITLPSETTGLPCNIVLEV